MRPHSCAAGDIMDKISVIVPVYNTELYIEKCLDSILCQTHTNLEVLAVDDGSTDNSGTVCDEYAKRDGRVRVLHKPNGGVSSARNFGLEHVTGKYVGFVDSDDRIEPELYARLYESAVNKKTQLAVCGFFKDHNGVSTPMSNRAPVPDRAIPAKDVMLFVLKRDHYLGFCGYLWNKLFLSQIIRNNDLRFAADINYGEDVLFLFEYILSKNCGGVYVDKPLYHYNQRDASIANSDEPGVKKDILTAYKRVEALLDNSAYPDISYWARGFYCYHAGVIAKAAQRKKDVATLWAMKREIAEHIADYAATNTEYPEKAERMRKLLELPD